MNAVVVLSEHSVIGPDAKTRNMIKVERCARPKAVIPRRQLWLPYKAVYSGQISMPRALRVASHATSTRSYARVIRPRFLVYARLTRVHRTQGEGGYGRSDRSMAPLQTTSPGKAWNSGRAREQPGTVLRPPCLRSCLL